MHWDYTSKPDVLQVLAELGSWGLCLPVTQVTPQIQHQKKGANLGMQPHLPGQRTKGFYMKASLLLSKRGNYIALAEVKREFSQFFSTIAMSNVSSRLARVVHNEV